MNIEELREYCLSLPDVTEHLPFDDVTLVYKVLGKMFALLPTDHELCISLKCDPERAIELRDQYYAITPAYHMNKKHWNTLLIDGSLPDKLVIELINHSYFLVKTKTSKKK